MDIDKFLHRDYFSDYGQITTLRDLKADFFREKVYVIFQKIRLAPICPCKQENLPKKMIEIFPTATVETQGDSKSCKDWEILHLPNVDVEREWDELSFFDAFR